MPAWPAADALITDAVGDGATAVRLTQEYLALQDA